MRRIHSIMGVLAVIFAVGLAGCSTNDGTGEDQNARVLSEWRAEHDRDDGEHRAEGRERRNEGQGEHDERGEESGGELSLDDAYDESRNGARLKLKYYPQTNSFKGTVENTTAKTLRRVRVEVHLSNRTELGPTTPSDLGPGEKKNLELKAKTRNFDRWTAHPEVGGGEHEHGRSEGHGGHGRED